jgi:Rad3-related DNA helicase
MARIKFLLDKLKYELNNNKKDLDPRQIEDISQQIERIEKLLNDRPYFKKGLDNLVKEIESTKDEIGSNGTSNKEIYDFDKDIVNTHLKNESVKINIYQLEKDIDNTSILTENSDEILDKFFNDHNNFLNEIISEAFVS